MVYTDNSDDNYTIEDYYNEFVKDYEDQCDENAYYNKLFFDKLWELAENGLSLTKVLGFVNSFDNDESHIDETSKETYNRFMEYWKNEFNEA